METLGITKNYASLNYIGSKHKLTSILFEWMKPYLEKYQVKTIGDLFCGSGAMSRFLFPKYNLVINDIMYYASVITEAQLINCSSDCPSIQEKIDHLNQVEPFHGKITELYSPAGSNERKFFTKENAMKLDGMRTQLENWKNQNQITEKEYKKLLGLILHFADKHANTTSVYGAYLKNFKQSAQKPIHISNSFTFTDNTHHPYFVYQKDILELDFELLPPMDAVYLDPPYNQRSYSKNYSPLETLAKYDDPEIKGKTGLRKDSDAYSGLFCKKSKAKDAFIRLAKKLEPIRLIFMSYNNEGLLNETEIKEIFEKQGRKVLCIKNEYKKYISKKNQKSNKGVEEYLFIIE
jgi:adenine-specific DNA-methyltransferase